MTPGAVVKLTTRLAAAWLLFQGNSSQAFEPPLNPTPFSHTATVSMEAAFSPWDDGEALIRRAISDARHAIYVQAYLFTSRSLAQALIEAKVRGVRVEVLADAHNVAGSRLPALVEAGIPVFLETQYAAAHNKVMIMDPEYSGTAVLTGSYNFTHSARTRNAENLLLIKGDRTLTRAYLINWKRHKADARPFTRSALYEGSSRRNRTETGTNDAGERLPFLWERNGQRQSYELQDSE